MLSGAVDVAGGRRGGCRPRRCGLSIVEMMVGIAIGLFVLAAASMVATSQLTGSRDAMVRVQMQQDLRVIGDMVAAAIARSTFYMGARNRLASGVAPATYAAPYDAMSLDTVDGAGSARGVELSASTDAAVSGVELDENDTIDDHDRLGFRFNAVAGTVEMRLRDGGWQTLSDPDLMRITDLHIDVVERFVQLPCGFDCEESSADCRWSSKTREFRVRIDARAGSNPTILRSIDQVVRARNSIVSKPTYKSSC